MPHLTLSVGDAGPVIDLYVGVSEHRKTALTTAGQPIPPMVLIRGLIDTGASGVVIDTTHLEALSLTPTGSTSCHTPSTSGRPVTMMTYDVMLALQHPRTHFTLGTHPIIASDLISQGQGIDALIGRDFLDHCYLAYNGSARLFTLAF
ncbi:MAG TPA: retropepsin-like aspartic protease [Tepidisphaeraceae bacterium]|jgi:predicted aspartyl protease